MDVPQNSTLKTTLIQISMRRVGTGASDSGLKRYTTSTLGPLVSSVAARGRVPWSIRAIWLPPMKLRIREWMLYNVLTQNQIPCHDHV